ncbi:MAG: tRNA uridine-5-carboxymethylaminomethyl(34) synthesis GTPase MnmE [Geobacteraceae bacterium GWC2_55_20]|nr:MAG: tRNA uridine-5-carboxymethylaminomethyl(34) synthesis GTPase MnmE [Geobacteraceae bacterium GWC2_55_20]OGU23673.1 MAG: tRNA uridine-5-carboxymethylaminomethyl(34) synthesis GTPase MnmE [Geobacteraceae bacterium GWF2_54_21]HBA71594.1 tRNA uridine-5-carboxymethylaminomethyl(34) synthesis GTPase MnmE [Geobacter sp.]HCE66376.1 tRNA uridine-5-carboxymethylaminomethyl(34) synthesis GTPase MnmE [Geobacter sp.]
MYVRDTIAAISTPPGNGGIGIVRVSGDKAAAIGDAVFKPLKDGGLESHRFYFGSISDQRTGRTVDEAMAVLMRAPRSFTREDVLELHCHGGWLVVETVLELVLKCGARLADPGEFTRRAFLNGRIDLVQAEAVMDIIASNTEAALSLAQTQREGALSRRMDDVRSLLLKALALVEAYIDFPEDDLGKTDLQLISDSVERALAIIDELLSSFEEGRLLRDGVSVLIIGKPNAGKSSLLNLLINDNRAIVTHIPGTTRDIIEETIIINGLAVKLLDTAGIRHTEDLVEQEGINRAMDKILLADLVLFVLDASRSFTAEDQHIYDALSGSRVVAVINKIDMPRQLAIPDSISFEAAIDISAKNGIGNELLKQTVCECFFKGTSIDRRELVAISRSRHRDALKNAGNVLRRFMEGLDQCGLELLSIDLREALEAVASVTGQTTNDEVLDQIFSSFCIGK